MLIFKLSIMNLFNKNIGLEFQYQMKVWLKSHPEILHKWNENHLVIYHPFIKNRKIDFSFSRNHILIKGEHFSKQFKRNIFKNLELYVLQIRGYWIHNFFPENDLKIREPYIKEA